MQVAKLSPAWGGGAPGVGAGASEVVVRVADFYQTLIAAIAVGSLYALVALGYTLVYGVLKFINFSHSDVFVLGAWTSFTAALAISTRMGIDPDQSPWWVGLCVVLLAIGVCGTTAFLVERFAYRPLRRAPRLNVLITAIGVSLLLQNVGQIPGWTVARGPEREQTKAESELTEAEKGRVIEVKDGVARVRMPGDPLATVPFGPIPRSMPRLLPDAVLNETVLAGGKMSGGSRRGLVRLDLPADLLEGGQYRLDVVKPGAAGRVESLNIASEAGHYDAGAELSTQPRRNPADLEGMAYRLLKAPLVPIHLVDILIAGSSVALMLGLEFLIFRTKIGTGMRAVSFNTEIASLMGVNVNFIISFTFVLGASLAGAAAFLYANKYPGLNQTAHGVWVLLGLKAFVAAVVGGIGNIRGAVLGGFLIAGIEFFGSRYVSTELKDVYVFGLLILVLLVRPSGLLGSTVREKV